MRYLCLASILSSLFTHNGAFASGMDVQLKDLRHSYFYVFGGTKDCAELNGPEIKKFGRLTHCDPESDFVECKLKSGEKLFLFEREDACEASVKNANPAASTED